MREEDATLRQMALMALPTTSVLRVDGTYENVLRTET